MEPNFKIKFDVFSNTFYLWISKNIENKYSYEDDFFLRKSKSEGETIGNNADTVLNDFTDLESEIFLQYFSG